jgi:hypothetical protein
VESFGTVFGWLSHVDSNVSLGCAERLLLPPSESIEVGIESDIGLLGFGSVSTPIMAGVVGDNEEMISVFKGETLGDNFSSSSIPSGAFADHVWFERFGDRTMPGGSTGGPFGPAVLFFAFMSSFSPGDSGESIGLIVDESDIGLLGFVSVSIPVIAGVVGENEKIGSGVTASTDGEDFGLSSTTKGGPVIPSGVV